MSRTTAVLVNYNNAFDTGQCIESLLQVHIHPKVVVVDNASRETGITEAVSVYPDAKIIYSDSNAGFGCANNLGIRWALSHTDCEFIFILNNDSIVRPDTILRLEKALDTYHEAGISCPRIVMAEKPGVLWYGGGEVDWRKGSARVPGMFGPALASLAMTPRRVSFASGCAMLIRRSVLEKVGGFDPRFFMYVEDLELCLRVQEAGWILRYVPAATVVHKGQGSQRRDGEGFFSIQHHRNPNLPFFIYHLTRNRLLTMTIHAKGWNAVLFWSFFPFYLLAKSAQCALIHGRWDALAAAARGIRDFIAVRRQKFHKETF